MKSRPTWLTLFFSALFLVSLAGCSTGQLKSGVSTYGDRSVDPTINLSQVELLKVDATESGIELGSEYESYAKSRKGRSGGTVGSGDFWRSVLLFFPNRVLDLVDIVRVDVGAGLGVGGVLRVTKWCQVGMRDFNPGSVRVGLRGRQLPAWWESHWEGGVGPAFHSSVDREVTPVEVGAGVDLGVGAYLGVSLDELVDFVLGFLGGTDIIGDDLQ